MAKKVYVVLNGEYEDVYNEAVFSKKKNAKEFAERTDGWVETHKVDRKSILKLLREEPSYAWRMLFNVNHDSTYSLRKTRDLASRGTKEVFVSNHVALAVRIGAATFDEAKIIADEVFAAYQFQHGRTV